MQDIVALYGFFDLALRAYLLATQSLVIGGVAFLGLVVFPQSMALAAARDRIVGRCLRILFWSAIALACGEFIAAGVLTATLVGTLQVEIAAAASANAVVVSLVAGALASALALLAHGGDSAYSRRGAIAAILALLLVGAHIGVTHASSRPDDAAALVAAEAVHLLAAAIWIGGIPYFLVALGAVGAGEPRWRVARRFSLLAMGAVATLIAGGVFMAARYVGTFQALYETNYGVMVATKIALLLGLLGFGAMNFFAIRKLRRDPSRPVGRLAHFAEVEIGVGLTALFCAAALATSSLAIDAGTEHVSLTEIADRFEPRWPRFESPAYAELSAAQRSTGGAESAADASAPASGPTAADIAWAETNHHFAGALVVLMGLFALLEHHQRAAPAFRHWPLLFLALAGFLVLRADEGAWPLGPVSFLDSLRDPQIAQHKLIVVLISAFALFEWRVRLKGFKSTWPAFVFPLTTGAAAAFLLTHYGHTNGKEEVLIEIGHTPIALLGVAAAGARWLEIRLDGDSAGRIAGFVWPVAFILAGVLLMFYREA